MQFSKTGLIAWLFAFLFVAAPAGAQEVILSVRPGVQNIPVYDNPAGKKIVEAYPHDLVNKRVRAKMGAWIEIADGMWVSSADVVLGNARPSANRPYPSDTSRGGTMGTPAPR